MLRLSVLLGLVMFATLVLAGADGGKLRPGLAEAVAEGREIVVLERARAPEIVLPAVEEVAAPVPEAPAAPAVVEVASAPPPEAPARRVIPEPVFTLSALPTIGTDKAELPVEAVADVATGDASIWYVTGNTVNVRTGPSTDTSVVIKLDAGEAVTVIAMDGGDWAQIVIEGDGVEGYVAARFLSQFAP